mmetsp:Transcript_26638/g.59593  ORF Transcript_26638/g.59593 Transcript_26638/m.59593 type:complete len:203 (-) Transcript_26638:592-1200(-)
MTTLAMPGWGSGVSHKARASPAVSPFGGACSLARPMQWTARCLAVAESRIQVSRHARSAVSEALATAWASSRPERNPAPSNPPSPGPPTSGVAEAEAEACLAASAAAAGWGFPSALALRSTSTSQNPAASSARHLALSSLRRASASHCALNSSGSISRSSPPRASMNRATLSATCPGLWVALRTRTPKPTTPAVQRAPQLTE